jgi:transposase
MSGDGWTGARALWTGVSPPLKKGLRSRQNQARQGHEVDIADRAYDSDPLRERLLAQDMLLIAPHRRGRTKPAFNDGRWLRRYRKRWKIERTFAWLGNYRRLVVRYENHLLMYQAFFHVACSLITLRYL